MILGRQALNRTLLRRQHLLVRSTIAPLAMVEHLVGLQAQENRPPYLSLNARLEQFDPQAVSKALGDKELVRLLVMRGTIHLLTPYDALTLRQFTQVSQDRERKASQNTKPALHLDLDAMHAAVDDVLEPGPLPVKLLGEALATEFDAPVNALGHLARVGRPLAQLPPRGQWKQSGGVVYQRVDRWLGRDLIEPDVKQVVRRYLAAFGPGTPADVTAWSGVPGMAPVMRDMDLEVHHDERGRVLYDVPGGEIVEDGPAPVRMFGTYDNVWLSHAGRDRVTDPAKRKSWMGTNGGVAGTILVDGWLEGLWRIEDGKVRVLQLMRDLTTKEARELSEEIERTQQLLDS